MSKQQQKQQKAPPKPDPTRPPLTPRPKLFILLVLIFAAWIAALLTMYFTSVYPERHHPPVTQPVATDHLSLSPERQGRG
ncbi:MAG TPA: hypothetical protein VH518_15150 [Tepidisphaeraceae bacterium]